MTRAHAASTAAPHCPVESTTAPGSPPNPARHADQRSEGGSARQLPDCLVTPAKLLLLPLSKIRERNRDRHCTMSVMYPDHVPKSLARSVQRFIAGLRD